VFGQDRNQTRQFFIDVWRKVNAPGGAALTPLERLIADIIDQHPEYQKLLNDDERALMQEYLPEFGQSNPFLHMGMHIAIREQLDSQRPAGIRQLWTQLSQRHNSSHEAEHRMMECLAETLWLAQRDNIAPDEQAYLTRLQALLQSE
jgi:hypothetical protein